MHIYNSNVDYEWVRMLNCTVWLIKTNTFILRTPIFKVVCNKFPCIRTFTLLNTSSNEWLEAFFSFREVFDWYGGWKKANISILVILKNKSYFHHCIWVPFKPSPIFFGVGLFFWYTLQFLIDQIWSKYLQDMFFGVSYFCIDWYWYWIFPVEFDEDWVHKLHLDMW